MVSMLTNTQATHKLGGCTSSLLPEVQIILFSVENDWWTETSRGLAKILNISIPKFLIRNSAWLEYTQTAFCKSPYWTSKRACTGFLFFKHAISPLLLMVTPLYIASYWLSKRACTEPFSNMQISPHLDTLHSHYTALTVKYIS